MTTQEQLERHCQSIADDITNGVIVTEEMVEYNPDLELGDKLSVWNYLEDMLDIDFTVSSDLSYKSCSICVAFGGPSIYINTANNFVEGYWWSNNTKVPFTDSMGVDDFGEELYDSKCVPSNGG